VNSTTLRLLFRDNLKLANALYLNGNNLETARPRNLGRNDLGFSRLAHYRRRETGRHLSA